MVAVNTLRLTHIFNLLVEIVHITHDSDTEKSCVKIFTIAKINRGVVLVSVYEHIYELEGTLKSELLSPYSDKKSAGNFGNLTVLLGNDDPAGLFFCRFLAISTQASSIIPRKSFTTTNTCNGAHVLSFEDPRW